MPLKELLLKSSSFIELLKQYSIGPADFEVKDENLILSEKKQSHQDVFKDQILIEGRNKEGNVTLIGTLYYNSVKNIAVFDLESAEKGKMAVVS